MERFNTIYEGAGLFHRLRSNRRLRKRCSGEAPTREICYSRTTFHPSVFPSSTSVWGDSRCVSANGSNTILGPTLEQLTQDLFSQCQSPQSSSLASGCFELIGDPRTPTSVASPSRLQLRCIQTFFGDGRNHLPRREGRYASPKAVRLPSSKTPFPPVSKSEIFLSKRPSG
jgi:hypothetical protein